MWYIHTVTLKPEAGHQLITLKRVWVCEIESVRDIWRGSEGREGGERRQRGVIHQVF